MSSASVDQAFNTSKTALLMPGGGARAAYQVGVLRGISDLVGDLEKSPFPILSGTSAGAINAVALASREQSFQDSCLWLENLWMGLEPEYVYRTDWSGITRNAWRLVVSLFNSGIAVGRPVALLDNLPLKQLLRDKIDFSGISRNLQNENLQAVSVTAMNYTEGVSVSFFQAEDGIRDAQESRGLGDVYKRQQLRHLMASTAIPTIFPPQRIGRNYYGDGALRQLAPISPVLHLGADKVLIISASGHRRTYDRPHTRVHSPAFGQVIGHLLNSAFIDSLETDIELLERMNELLTQSDKEFLNPEGRALTPIDIEVISPSENIDAIADEYVASLPRSLRTFLGASGGSSGDGDINIASYLLFSPDYCRRLIDLGYKDAKDRAEDILNFLRK